MRAHFVTILIVIVARQANAGIIVEVADVAGAMRMTTSGSFNTTGLTPSGVDSGSDLSDLIDGTILRGGTTTFSVIAAFAPSTVSTPLSSIIVGTRSNSPSQNIGDIFVYSSPGVIGFEVDGSFTIGDTVTPHANVLFSGASILDTFGTNLDAGPVTLTTFTNGETISIARVSAVPEPGCFFCLGVLSGCLFLRRRKSH